MNKTTKIWLGVGSFALAQIGPGLAVEKDSLLAHSSLVPLAWAGESGEGAGGEQAATDDGVFLTQLGLLQGHLLAGMELYQKDAKKVAAAHIAHPLHELWENLEVALEARKAPNFEDELKQLAALADAGAPVAELEKAYQSIDQKVGAARATVKADAATQIKVIANLVRTAGEEYGVGVKNHQLAELHEYQDAYGFVKEASILLGQMDAASRAKLGATYATIEHELDNLAPLWPNILFVAGEKLGDAATLHAAAARIELKASSVK